MERWIFWEEAQGREGRGDEDERRKVPFPSWHMSLWKACEIIPEQVFFVNSFKERRILFNISQESLRSFTVDLNLGNFHSFFLQQPSCSVRHCDPTWKHSSLKLQRFQNAFYLQRHLHGHNFWHLACFCFCLCCHEPLDAAYSWNAVTGNICLRERTSHGHILGRRRIQTDTFVKGFERRSLSLLWVFSVLTLSGGRVHGAAFFMHVGHHCHLAINRKRSTDTSGVCASSCKNVEVHVWLFAS